MSDYSGTKKLGIEQPPDNKAPDNDCDVLFGAISELAARAMQGGRTREGALALVSEAFRFILVRIYRARRTLSGM